MQVSTPKRPSLSTWAAHNWIGYANWDSPAVRTQSEPQPDTAFRVFDRCAELEIHTIEVCHFHCDRFNMNPMRKAAVSAGVKLYQLLLDDGDLSHEEHSARDENWLTEWLHIARDAGFDRVRVIAGKTAPHDAFDRVIPAMQRLCDRASESGLRIVFENWHALMATPENVLHLNRELGDRAGLCFDFGNWSGPSKYDNLKQIVHLAESCHAKCNYADGQPDFEDFRRCIEITREVEFNGPYTIVHGEPGDPWPSIAAQLDVLRESAGF